MQVGEGTLRLETGTQSLVCTAKWQTSGAWVYSLEGRYISIYIQQRRISRAKIVAGVTMYMLVYVDDIIVASSSTVATDKLLQRLAKEFTIKDLGKLGYFLGVEVTEDNGGITLTILSMSHIFFSRQILSTASQFLHQSPTERSCPRSMVKHWVNSSSTEAQLELFNT